jgi:hypothetical protein
MLNPIINPAIKNIIDSATNTRYFLIIIYKIYLKPEINKLIVGF